VIRTHAYLHLHGRRISPYCQLLQTGSLPAPIRPQYHPSAHSPQIFDLRSSSIIQSTGFPNRILKRHLFLDLRNRQSGVQALGARPRAVEDGVASVQTHAVIQCCLSLLLLRVSRVCDPSVALHQDSRSKILLRVPPVGGA
jgi:hypothetical protein